MTEPSFEEYNAWHLKTVGEDLANSESAMIFELNSNNLYTQANDLTFFAGLPRFLEEVARDGLGTLISTEPGKPLFQLSRKPYKSVVNKLFRHNVVWNNRFPAPPRKEGWFKLATVFNDMDDLVRSSLVGRFVDEPKAIAEALNQRAAQFALPTRIQPTATTKGYYAYHFYTKIPVDLIDWATKAPVSSAAWIEIQITTQLQELLRGLTHKIYEEHRIRTNRKLSDDWWDLNSSTFKASYLGHTLHLIEAMLVELKNSSRPTPEILT